LRRSGWWRWCQRTGLFYVSSSYSVRVGLHGRVRIMDHTRVV
jgi:hypothetical protein